MQKNELLDTAELLIGANTPDDIWGAAETIAHAFGVSALTVADVDLSASRVIWANSSMNDDWLVQYGQSDYSRVDPFLRLENHVNGLVTVTCGSLSMTEGHAADALDLNHGLRDAGYSALQGHVAVHAKDGTSRMVSFCFQDGAEHGLASGTARALSRLIGAAIDAPLPDHHRATFLKPDRARLSDRERDVLSLLAEGRLGYEIAHHLGISETMVQRHLRKAREKLNARTREEALLIAIRTQQISI